MKIYLAGKIPKGDAAAKTFDFWQTRYKEVLDSVYGSVEYVDPSKMKVDEGNPFQTFGLDCTAIKDCDMVVMNAETKIGPGTAQEMVVAKYFKKPVVSVIPKDTHHRRSNVVFEGKNVSEWIHPFILSLSDFVIEDISDFHSIKDDLASADVKDITVIDSAIDYAYRTWKEDGAD